MSDETTTETETETNDAPDDTEADEAEGQPETDEGEPEKPAPKAKAAPPPPKTYKTKANGREIEVPAEHVDAMAKALNVDPDVLLRGAGMFRAGQEKAREAAEIAKKATALEARLKKDPGGVLREVLGDEAYLKLSVAEVAKLADEEELRTKDPGALERRKLEAEVARLKAEREEAAKKTEETEAQEYQRKAAERLDGEIKTALEKGRLPADPYIVRRLASHMLSAMATADDPDDLSLDDFLPLVMDEMQREHTTFLGKLSGAQVIDLYPELAEKVRKEYASRAPGARLARPPAKQPEQPPERKPEERKRPQFKSTTEVLQAFKAGRLG